jgi:hypothetical protein
MSGMTVASEAQTITVMVCGICALEVRNELHGLTDKKFDSPMAEHMRQLAVKWRKKHADLKPTVM